MKEGVLIAGAMAREPAPDLANDTPGAVAVDILLLWAFSARRAGAVEGTAAGYADLAGEGGGGGRLDFGIARWWCVGVGMCIVFRNIFFCDRRLLSFCRC